MTQQPTIFWVIQSQQSARGGEPLVEFLNDSEYWEAVEKEELPTNIYQPRQIIMASSSDAAQWQSLYIQSERMHGVPNRSRDEVSDDNEYIDSTIVPQLVKLEEQGERAMQAWRNYRQSQLAREILAFEEQVYKDACTYTRDWMPVSNTRQMQGFLTELHIASKNGLSEVWRVLNKNIAACDNPHGSYELGRAEYVKRLLQQFIRNLQFEDILAKYPDYVDKAFVQKQLAEQYIQNFIAQYGYEARLAQAALSIR